MQSGSDGEFGFRGEIREIVPNEKVVHTFEFEGWPGKVSVETLTLTEKDGKGHRPPAVPTAPGFTRGTPRAARDGGGTKRNVVEQVRSVCCSVAAKRRGPAR